MAGAAQGHQAVHAHLDRLHRARDQYLATRGRAAPGHLDTRRHDRRIDRSTLAAAVTQPIIGRQGQVPGRREVGHAAADAPAGRAHNASASTPRQRTRCTGSSDCGPQQDRGAKRVVLGMLSWL